MKIQAYQCDECGVQKKESNHWVLAQIDGRDIRFTEWHEFIAASPYPPLTLCGEGCAAKVLSKQVASWKSVREEVKA